MTHEPGPSQAHAHRERDRDPIVVLDQLEGLGAGFRNHGPHAPVEGRDRGMPARGLGRLGEGRLLLARAIS